MSRRERHYWIIAHSYDSREMGEIGKTYLIYGGITEIGAREKALEMLGGTDFIIKMLPTRDLAAASSMHKGRRLEQTHSLKQASQRLGHSKSLKRREERRRRMSRW